MTYHLADTGIFAPPYTLHAHVHPQMRKCARSHTHTQCLCGGVVRPKVRGDMDMTSDRKRAREIERKRGQEGRRSEREREGMRPGEERRRGRGHCR